MPESEALKVIIQLGSFGLIAIGVVWVLFRGAPMLRDMLKGLSEAQVAAAEKVAEAHEEAIRILTAACREDSRAMLTWFSEEMKRRDDVSARLAASIEKLADKR
jgi:hypothetical protein